VLFLSWPDKKVIYTGVLITFIVISVATFLSMKTFPSSLDNLLSVTGKHTYVDRHGHFLNVTYENKWNIYNRVKIHDVPEFLQNALIQSEDKRFFSHHGADWLARINALRQNILAGKVVRGASTITEQVVRMIHPRPRTIWSRWVEGFEAMMLESHVDKLTILEFYLNQVPYKANRRGIIQAAHYYFDRDIHTLNEKEMLVLSVLVRSPRWLDPNQQADNIERAIINLVERLYENKLIEKPERIIAQRLSLSQPVASFNTQHFIEYVNTQIENNHHQDTKNIHTTIDSEIQHKTQRILDNEIDRLNRYNVHNGAVLIIDHETNEILSWVVAYAGKHDQPFNQINAVIASRQPGSTLKPLLYANALTKGWTAATLINDSPLEESVGLGLHAYHNYSRTNYGPISLREALGNSLNIPAVKTVQFVGPENFLTFLSNVGIQSLSSHPDEYGDGLALGNGEVTLFELVQAYTVIARMGSYKPLSFIDGDHLSTKSHQVFSEDIASLIADIMSDYSARDKEFGRDSVLNFPRQTAVKTGTSSDYRDAWAVGFDDKYTVGIWMGNLDYTEMHEITGSTGPALILRSIFNELNHNRDVKPLFFSNHLVKQRVCIETGEAENNHCKARDEWFVPGTYPQKAPAAPVIAIRIRKPGQGMMMAMDPRIPDDHEYFEFKLTDVDGIKRVNWFVNNKLVGTTDNNTYLWKLTKGKFIGKAEVWLEGGNAPFVTETVAYMVN